jgi:hypothetical protein
MALAITLVMLHPAVSTPISTPDCASLATNDTFDLSFEGSWSYLHLDPTSPLNAGSIGYMTYSDYSPRGYLWPNPLALTVTSLWPEASVACESTGYEWRPDYAVSNSSCASDAVHVSSDAVDVSMSVAFHSNATICVRYIAVRAAAAAASTVSSPVRLRFSGSVPPTGQKQMHATASLSSEGAVDVVMAAVAEYAGESLFINRTWAVRTDIAHARATLVNGSSYAWEFELPQKVGSDSPFEATFCITEMETGVGPSAPPMTHFDPSPTTRNIDAWLAELTPIGVDPVPPRWVLECPLPRSIPSSP